MCRLDRMDFLPMIKRHSGADSHHLQFKEELNEAKSDEAQTEWGWGGWEEGGRLYHLILLK